MVRKQLSVVICLCLVITVLLQGCSLGKARLAEVQLEWPEFMVMGAEAACTYTLVAEMGEAAYTQAFGQTAGAQAAGDAQENESDGQARRAMEQMAGWLAQWASDDETIIVVDASGLMTAVGAGTAKVSLTVEDEIGTVVQVDAAVTVVVPVESVEAPQTVQIEVGASLDLQARALPADATDPGLAYAVDDSGIATVDANGTLTGVANGTAMVTISSTDKYTQAAPPEARVEVQVVTSPQDIQLNMQQASLAVGATRQLEALVLPEEVNTPYELEWTSSDEAVATVDETGLVKGVAAGSALVSVSIAGADELVATCEVTVTAPRSLGTGGAGGAASAGVNMQELLDLVNAARADAGVSPLAWSDTLGDAANIRANELISLFSHTRPDGTDWYTVSDLARGENVAAGFGSVQAVFNGWMESDGHRANILNAGFTLMGGGCVAGGGTYYWCQLFG